MSQSGQDSLDYVVCNLAAFYVVLGNSFKDINLTPLIAVIDGGKHLVQYLFMFKRQVILVVTF